MLQFCNNNYNFLVTVTPDYDPESVTFTSSQSTNHKSYQSCLLSR
nr:MAG TPA: hypothetical protein [Caudoviricetes sp.]